MLTMYQEDKGISRDKSPSPNFINMVEEWADSYIKSVELPPKIIEAAKKEQLSPKTVRETIENVLRHRGLSERRIAQLIPAELKNPLKITKKPASSAALIAAKDTVMEEQSNTVTETVTTPADDKMPAEPPKVKDEPLEDPKDLEIQFLKEQVSELQEALKKTEQFKPATDLQPPPISNPDEHYFKWLADRDNKVNNFYYGNCGIDFFIRQVLGMLKGSGVKMFKRLYFEV